VFRQLLPYDSPTRPVRAIMGDPMPAGVLYGMHFHTEFEFVHVITGSLKLFSEAGEFIVNQGDIFFANADIPHSTETLEDNTLSMRLQFVDPSTISGPMHYLSKFLKQSDAPSHVFRSGTPACEELLSYMKTTNELDTVHDTANDCYMIAIMYMVTSLLYREHLLASKSSMSDSKIIGKIIPVLEYIDSNFEEDITLDTLSGILNLNKQYLCRLFKKATGSTIIDYLNFVRTCKAESFLKTDMNISDVAYKVGFSSPSYFNKIFKRYKLCTPLTYRKILMHRERDDDSI